MSDLALAKTTGAATALFAATGTYFALTDTVMVSLITNGCVLVLGCFTVVFAHKAKVAATDTQVVADKTHELVNSRMTEFMEMAKKYFHAEGVAQEKTDEQARKSAGIIAKASGVEQEKTDEKNRSMPPPPDRWPGQPGPIS